MQVFESPPPFGGVTIKSPFGQEQIPLGGAAVSNTTDGGLRWEYHSTIKGLRGPSADPTLDSFDFTNWLEGSLIIIVIDPGTGKERQEWLVVGGPAVSTNPGQIILSNYHPVTNNKHLERVA